MKIVQTLTRLAVSSSRRGIRRSPKMSASRSMVKKKINIRDQRVIQKARLENSRKLGERCVGVLRRVTGRAFDLCFSIRIILSITDL